MVLLELLIPIRLVHLLGIDWELHHHVLPLAVQRRVVRLRAMPLVPDLLHAHERAEAANGADGADS